MRITRQALQKVVRDTVARRTRANRNLLAAYLSGSLLEEEYLLGGTADIDLVFLHIDDVENEREIVHLTDQVHLDIAHHFHRDYRNPRSLRVHPWLGPSIYRCQVLHDPQHFMDFTQASVRGQFFRSDHVLERVRKQAEHARQIWQGFVTEAPEPTPKGIAKYFLAVDHAANAVASLSGDPLTERRFLLKFPGRAEAVGRPGLHAGLLGLLGAPKIDQETMQAWLPQWRAAFESLPSDARPARLHPDRKEYYLRAFEALVQSEQPAAVLWPLLRTWTQMAQCFPAGAPAQADWTGAMQSLGLTGDGLEERVEALDVYLDMVEETIETWARENGG
jgi:hypothetical protein